MEDARWKAVDEYAEAQLRTTGNPKHDASLAEANRLSEVSVMPGAEVSPMQGRFLAAQCQLINARNILEIGTLTAYSTVWLASTGPDVHVTTIEVDPKTKELADKVIMEAGLTERVEVVLGKALDVLPRIRAEVEGSNRGLFDFVFVDADKQNNLTYFNESIAMCRSRACIIVDNVVRKGAIVDDTAAGEDGRVKGARQVIEAAGSDERILSATMVQTVGEKGWDGFLLCVVK